MQLCLALVTLLQDIVPTFSIFFVSNCRYDRHRGAEMGCQAQRLGCRVQFSVSMLDRASLFHFPFFSFLLEKVSYFLFRFLFCLMAFVLLYINHLNHRSHPARFQMLTEWWPALELPAQHHNQTVLT